MSGMTGRAAAFRRALEVSCGPFVSGKLMRIWLMLRCIRGRLGAEDDQCCTIDERPLSDRLS